MSRNIHFCLEFIYEFCFNMPALDIDLTWSLIALTVIETLIQLGLWCWSFLIEKPLPLGRSLTHVFLLLALKASGWSLLVQKRIPMNSSLVTVLFLSSQLMTLKWLWHFEETLSAAILNPIHETLVIPAFFSVL